MESDLLDYLLACVILFSICFSVVLFFVRRKHYTLEPWPAALLPSGESTRLLHLPLGVGSAGGRLAVQRRQHLPITKPKGDTFLGSVSYFVWSTLVPSQKW